MQKNWPSIFSVNSLNILNIKSYSLLVVIAWWPENPHKVDRVRAGKKMLMEVEQRSQMTRCKESVSSCRARDGQMRLWNLAWLMGVDWILPPFSFTASFTHTQTELQCYSERVSCLNPRTESEKERKAERGEGGSKRNKGERERLTTRRFTECLL